MSIKLFNLIESIKKHVPSRVEHHLIEQRLTKELWILHPK
jgi:hypothetical protein